VKRRRWFTALGACILALLALEVVLQVAACVAWQRRGHAAGPSDILCVGDSFTYGLGATGEGGSYPRQLEALLRARGETVAVVNGGWPGQTSREVLLRLPEQLRRHRPRKVCVLVGNNDPVLRPALLRDDELTSVPAAGFPWRLRLPQVFVMMANWVRRRDAGVPPFVGTWHAGELEVTFERDGRVVLGKDEVRWLADENGTLLMLPSGVQPMQWELAGGNLTVRTRDFTHTLAPGPAPAPSPLVAGNKALARGELAAARALLEEAVARPHEAAAARQALVQLAVKAQDSAGAARWLAELRAQYASGEPGAGAELAQALVVTGEVPQACAVAERVLLEQPDVLRAWDVLLTHGLAKLGRQHVLAFMTRVLDTARGDAAWRPALLQMRANLRQHDAPADALHDVFVAFLQNGDAGFLQRQVEVMASAANAREDALARLTPESAARVRKALAADPGTSGVLATLRAHLERIVALSRSAGAEVWLLTYPEPDAARDPLVAGVAQATGAHFVVLHPHFTSLLADTPRVNLFIADGHCTDRGYGEMAAVVAEALK
jgi:hypothetical protein